MKIKKIIFVILISFIMLTLKNFTNAFTITMNDVSAKKGEEFSVNVSLDEYISIANGYIQYDSSKVEFVKSSQQYLETAVTEEGTVAWVYLNEENLFVSEEVNENSEKFGTKNLEFTFKIKENGASQIKFEDFAFVGVDGAEYDTNNTQGNTTINVNNKKNNKVILIGFIAIVLVAIIILKNKK
ncbi:MAG: hypothetical protein J6A89_06835 [Clostridia bacterium]|nr:hypothetical protein [Clostridia bacterium]